MPGGFNMSAIKSYLSKILGLGPQRADGVLLLAGTMVPPERLKEATVKSCLDGVVAVYAQCSSISLSSGQGGGAAGGGAGGAVANSGCLNLQAEQEQFTRQ